MQEKSLKRTDCERVKYTQIVYKSTHGYRLSLSCVLCNFIINTNLRWRHWFVHRRDQGWEFERNSKTFDNCSRNQRLTKLMVLLYTNCWTVSTVNKFYWHKTETGRWWLDNLSNFQWLLTTNRASNTSILNTGIPP